MVTLTVVKSLYGRSGNRCAFQNCDLPLVEESDVVTGEICHIHARSVGGPRYAPDQTDKERDAAANLILLCARHHKIVDGDPAKFTAASLYAMKSEHELRGTLDIVPEDARRAKLLLQKLTINVRGDLSASIHTQNVTINSARSTKAKPVPTGDVVGGSSCHRTYLKYLIERYQEFARAQRDREFNYAVIYLSIRRKFKAEWDWIPLSRFGEVTHFMQVKIDGTILGRQRKKQGKSSYEDFDSYQFAHR